MADYKIAEGTCENIVFSLNLFDNSFKEYSALYSLFSMSHAPNPLNTWNNIKQSLNKYLLFEEHLPFDQVNRRLINHDNNYFILPAVCMASLNIKSYYKSDYKDLKGCTVHVKGPIDNYDVIYRKNIDLSVNPEKVILKAIDDLFKLSKLYTPKTIYDESIPKEKLADWRLDALNSEFFTKLTKSADKKLNNFFEQQILF